jgi:hypothetical protein
MQDGYTDYRKIKWFSLRCFLLIPTLSVLGCASAPAILPIGAPELAKQDWVQHGVAYSAFPVLVTKTPGTHDKKLEISVTWRGKWLWWETIPFATATHAEFSLSQPGASKSLCTVEIKNTGKETDVLSCEYKVLDYTSTPLVGELTYYFGDNKAPGGEPVLRMFYVINQPRSYSPPPPTK